MKGIKLCGECGDYDYKNHRCRIGCIDDSNTQASFYGDCPLPDVVPKSEVEKLKIEIEALKIANEKMYEANKAQSREIFEEIKKHGRKMSSSDFSGYFWDVAVLMSDIETIEKKYSMED